MCRVVSFPATIIRVKKFLNSQVGERLAVWLGGEERGDDVVGRIVSPLQRNVLGIAKDLEGSRRPERQ